MPFIEMTDRTLEDKIIEINLKGTINCTRVVINWMIKQQYGRIVNIASDAGRVGAGGSAVYSATKGGVIAFTKAIAKEVARNNVLVNCVSPGPTETQLFLVDEGQSPKRLEKIVQSTLLRRLAKPQEVANAVLFLASEEASYITGQTLSVSAGITMC